MKKITVYFGMLASITLASCQKQDSTTPDNEWIMGAKTFPISDIIINSSGNSISGVDGKGSSIDFSFATMPTKTADYTPQAEAYEATDISIRSVLSGSIIYQSIDNSTGTVTVHADNSGYKVMMTKVPLVNTVYPFDTTYTTAYLAQ